MLLSLLGLAACESFQAVSVAPPSLTSELGPPEAEPPGPVTALHDASDDLDLGKRHFREENFGLAEVHFRRVVEKGGGAMERQAEAWLGLAASYDRLHRFELADRAYKQVVKLIGPTAAVLNNEGYSYMMRGNFTRARAVLLRAHNLEPDNPYIRNNIALLENNGAVP
jgi:Flp pilus assembly protein TadD